MTGVPSSEPQPVVAPIYLSAAFEHGGEYWYSRQGNPTIELLEVELAAWEGAPAAAVLPSGMAAISAALTSTCARQARVVASSHLYPGTEALLRAMADRQQLSVDFLDTAACDPEDLPGCDVLMLELPSNPALHVPDLVGLSRAAKERGALTIVDATLATPVFCRPLQLGADIVVHSLTKFASGAGDVLGGVVLGDVELVGRIRYDAVRLAGAVTSPLTAHLILRSLESANLRIERQSRNAADLVNALRRSLDPGCVLYPGWEAAPETADVAPFGAVVGLFVRDAAEVLRLADDRALMVHAASVGDSRTLVTQIHPENFPPASRAALERLLPTGRGLIRLSIGTADPDRLTAALLQTLS